MLSALHTGFEPANPFGSTVFKTASSPSGHAANGRGVTGKNQNASQSLGVNSPFNPLGILEVTTYLQVITYFKTLRKLATINR